MITGAEIVTLPRTVGATTDEVATITGVETVIGSLSPVANATRRNLLIDHLPT
jgi:hypothetical protein